MHSRGARSRTHGDTPAFSGRMFVTPTHEHRPSVNPASVRVVLCVEAGYRGRYPVHEASRVQMLRLLMRHGAELNVHDDDGQTPLHVASRYSHIRVVHELVAGGADWQAVDHLGRSAVHHAALGNAVCVFFTLSPVGVRSIMIRASIGWSSCISLKPYAQISHLLPVAVARSFSDALRCLIYFRFCGWRYVFIGQLSLASFRGR